MNKSPLILLLATITLLFTGCSGEKKETKTTSSEIISKKEYAISGLDASDLLIKQEQNGFIIDGTREKIVLFDIFATWCPPCRAGAKNLSSLQAKYPDDLVVIGLSIEEEIEKQKLQDFAKEYEASYFISHSPQTKNLVYDVVKSLKVGPKYPIPLMALYKDGKLINYYSGATQEEFIESDIKNALDEK